MEHTTLLHIKHTNDYKYYVIQFLELPNEDINEIVCIPWMWIVSHRARDLNVVVSYPVENPSYIEKRVKDREKHLKQWKLYKAVVIYATDSYQDAKHFATERMNEIHSKYDQCANMKLKGHHSSAKLEKTTHRSKRSANSNPKNSKPLEFTVSSNNYDTSGLKRSKVVELAEAFSSPNENQSSPTVENPSNSSVEPRIVASREFFSEFFTLLRDLRTTTPAKDAAMIDLLRETLIQNAETMRKVAKLNDDTRASLASSTITAETSTLKGSSRKLKFVLPPEYDENDSRWTLKHRQLTPGLVELMPHTRVYIDADKLSHFQILAKDCKSLARMLTLEIFTESALSVCSFTGVRAKATDVQGTAVRPGLDENARNVLVRFVQEYGKEKHGITVETISIQNSVRYKMQEIRMKYERLVCS